MEQIRGLNALNEYTFMPYDAKAPITETGFRTVPILYKTNTKTGIKAGENSCALIPYISDSDITDNMSSLLPYIKNMLELEQNKIFKDAHLAKSNSVAMDKININAIVTYMKESKTSGVKINKEMITAYFNDNLADKLTLLFADKLNVTPESSKEELDKVDMFVGVYKNKYSALASNLVSYQKEEATKLMEALDKCEIDTTENPVAQKIASRLDKMINPTSSEELLMSL